MSKAWAEKHNVPKPQSYKDKEETYAVRNAMGTGAYTLKQRDPDVKTVMAKNPTYWGAKDFPNYPDELVYTPMIPCSASGSPRSTARSPARAPGRRRAQATASGRRSPVARTSARCSSIPGTGAGASPPRCWARRSRR